MPPATFFAAAAAGPLPGWELLGAVFSIVLIDLVLAGDNAVVIALAVRTLEKRQRLAGIIIGSSVAVVLRVGLTLVASQLLGLSYIKLVGGALVLWIAVRLLRETPAAAHSGGRPAQHLWQAVWLIFVADVTMSIDNVLAVAAASHGNLALLLFGLGLSIPFVVFASNLLSKLMDRHPVIVWLGAAILGKVGGEMIVTDHLFFPGESHPGPWLVHGAELLATAGVIGLGLLARRRSKRGK